MFCFIYYYSNMNFISIYSISWHWNITCWWFTLKKNKYILIFQSPHHGRWMSWWHQEPGHQLVRYWASLTRTSWTSNRKSYPIREWLVTLASWHLRSLAIGLFVRKLCRLTTKKTPKLLTTNPLWDNGTGSQWAVDSLHKGSVIQKFFHVMTSITTVKSLI